MKDICVSWSPTWKSTLYDNLGDSGVTIKTISSSSFTWNSVVNGRKWLSSSTAGTRTQLKTDSFSYSSNRRRTRSSTTHSSCGKWCEESRNFRKCWASSLTLNTKNKINNGVGMRPTKISIIIQSSIKHANRSNWKILRCLKWRAVSPQTETIIVVMISPILRNFSPSDFNLYLYCAHTFVLTILLKPWKNRNILIN